VDVPRGEQNARLLANSNNHEADYTAAHRRLMSDLKHGNIRSNALTTILRQQNVHIPCEKSGGGV